MNELRELARTLLAEGQVKVVIGWEEGPRGVRPTFVTDPTGAEKLIFDERCVHNLATYLNPRRSHLGTLGKAAVVVKGCDAKAVAGLLREAQLKREDVVVIGVRCGGVLDVPTKHVDLSAENVARRCVGCETREPALADHVVGPTLPASPVSSRPDPLAKLESMTSAERWAFWRAELAKCVRCHACREVCPMCFCERCVADKTSPQWIESSPHGRGNLAWHVTRALHLAGRCVGCGECARACPVDIPLGLLNAKLARIVEERFGFHVCDDPQTPAPIGEFRLDDAQEFIL